MIEDLALTFTINTQGKFIGYLAPDCRICANRLFCLTDQRRPISTCTRCGAMEDGMTQFTDKFEMLQQARKRVRAIEFGDPVTNICAGENNPQRLAYFVSFDGKQYAKCTDRKGKFWNTAIDVVYPRHFDFAECNRLFDPVHAVLFPKEPKP